MLKAKVRSTCLGDILWGEVCANTCYCKYCVSKIDKISFEKFVLL